MIKVDVNKITVTVKGREVTLSEKELISILEEHFKILNVVKGVEVNPILIDESIFEIGEKEHYSHKEYIILVGGSEEFNDHDSATSIHDFNVNSFYQLSNAVPAIVRYK